MIANIAGADGIIVLIVALVVLVGGSQLPKIARNVGLAGKEFRRAQAEAEEEKRARAEGAVPPPPVALPTPPGGAASSAPAATSTAATAAAATPASVPAGGAAAGEDSITLTPAQLEALLKAREEQVRGGQSPQPGNN